MRCCRNVSDVATRRVPSSNLLQHQSCWHVIVWFYVYRERNQSTHRTFQPRLWRDRTLCLCYGWRDGTIVAGYVLLFTPLVFKSYSLLMCIQSTSYVILRFLFNVFVCIVKHNLTLNLKFDPQSVDVPTYTHTHYTIFVFVSSLLSRQLKLGWRFEHWKRTGTCINF